MAAMTTVALIVVVYFAITRASRIVALIFRLILATLLAVALFGVHW